MIHILWGFHKLHTTFCRYGVVGVAQAYLTRCLPPQDKNFCVYNNQGQAPRFKLSKYRGNYRRYIFCFAGIWMIRMYLLEWVTRYVLYPLIRRRLYIHKSQNFGLGTILCFFFFNFFS